MPVYQHWDPLKKCILGKSYPPEFYSWIKNPKARSAMERIAQETEEDYQTIQNKLESFGVDVVRPEVGSNHEEYYIPKTNRYAPPPMTPRDHIGTFGNRLIIDSVLHKTLRYYSFFSDPSWPNINSIEDLQNLDDWIKEELRNVHNVDLDYYLSQKIELQSFYDLLDKHNIEYELNNSPVRMNTACVCRIGKDLLYPGHGLQSADPVIAKKLIKMVKDTFGNEYRVGFYDGISHGDSCFCPVVPGLAISLHGYLVYKDTFPDWEVVELPDQSWNKVAKFLALKERNHGKWWVPGEENNDALTECVENWLDNWVGYVEETVFDVNMLVIDEKNVIVNNENDKVFSAFERHGVTPHVCNFRHRYFWDGGIHCITSDLEREGEMKDYFPEREK